MPISKAEKQKLMREMGFNTEESINRNNRIIMAVTGPEKSGKTTFGLTMPPPIAYFNFDRMIEPIALETAGVGEDDLIIKRILVAENQNQAHYKKLWDGFVKAFTYLLTDAKTVRSVLVDTETDMWVLIRLMQFGKTTEVMPYMYRQVNTPYRALLNLCDKCDKNVVFTRKLRKQYKNDQWNGKWEPAGMSEVKDIAQVNADMFMDDDGANIQVHDNAFSALMNGEVWTAEMCNFPMVASMLTNTDMGEWE